MRDRYEDDHDVAEDEPALAWRVRVGVYLSVWGGAALALTILVAAAVWGYRLTQRDASAIPVIHAALTAAKVQPAESVDQSGRQGITSYDAGSRSPGVPAVTFAPPPERPAAEDVAMGSLQEGAAQPGAEAAGAAPGTLPGDGTDLAPEVSPTAPARPRDLALRMATASQQASEEEKLAAAAAASRVQIQLGAFPSRDETEAEWARIYRANEDILAKRALVVQSTISGGRRFFRLRAGPFKDRIEAQNTCRALQARGQDCLVAVNG